jgi:hypothetical protein
MPDKAPEPGAFEGVVCGVFLDLVVDDGVVMGVVDFFCFGLGDVKLIAGDAEGLREEEEGDLWRGMAVWRRGGVIEVTRIREGESMEVYRLLVTEAVGFRGLEVRELFIALLLLSVGLILNSTRGNDCGGALIRLDASEGIEVDIRFANGETTPIGVALGDRALIVVATSLPLVVRDALEDARGFPEWT